MLSPAALRAKGGKAGRLHMGHGNLLLLQPGVGVLCLGFPLWGAEEGSAAAQGAWARFAFAGVVSLPLFCFSNIEAVSSPMPHTDTILTPTSQEPTGPTQRIPDSSPCEPTASSSSTPLGRATSSRGTALGTEPRIYLVFRLQQAAGCCGSPDKPRDADSNKFSDVPASN